MPIKKIISAFSALSKYFNPQKIKKPRLTGKILDAPGVPHLSSTEPDKFKSYAAEYKNLRDEAARRDPKTGTRPDVVRDADADALGLTITEDHVRALFPGAVLSDAEIIAYGKVVTRAANKTSTLGHELIQSNWAPEAQARWNEQFKVFSELNAKFQAVMTESGRALRVYDEGPGFDAQHLAKLAEVPERATTTVTDRRLVHMFMRLEKPSQKANFAKQSLKPTFGDYWPELWMGSLLLNPKSWAANGLATAAHLMWQVPVRGLAGQIGRVRRKAGEAVGAIAGEAYRFGEEAAEPGEATQMWLAMWRHLGDAWRASYRIALSDDAATATLHAERGVNKQGLSLEPPKLSAEAFQKSGWIGKGLDLLGWSVRSGQRILYATDTLIRFAGSRMQMQANAHRVVVKEARNRGLRRGTKKYNEFYTHRVEAILADPDPAILKDAEDFSSYVAFTQRLGKYARLKNSKGQSIGQIVQDFGRHPLGRLVAPFTTAPANDAGAAVEHIPFFNLAVGRYRKAIAAGDYKSDVEMARTSLGGLALATFAGFAAQGILTGAAPKHPGLRAAYYGAGFRPYSWGYDTDGDGQPDYWVGYNRLGWLGSIMGAAADYVTIASQWTDADLGDLAFGMSASISQNFTNKTYVQGISKAINALSDPAQGQKKFMENFASSLVPFGTGLGAVAQEIDPIVRDTNGAIDRILSRLPGMGKDLPADRDLFGNARFVTGGWGRDILPPVFQPAIDFVSPVYVARASNPHKKIFKVLWDNQIGVPQFGDIIGNIRITPKQRERGIILAGREIKLRGKTLDKYLTDVIFSTPIWKAAKGGRGSSRELQVKNAVNAFYTAAKLQLQKEYPELEKMVKEERQRLLNLKMIQQQSTGTQERPRNAIGVR